MDSEKQWIGLAKMWQQIVLEICSEISFTFILWKAPIQYPIHGFFLYLPNLLFFSPGTPSHKWLTNIQAIRQPTVTNLRSDTDAKLLSDRY